MEFSNYEADQSALYSGAHHENANSEESKAKVKNIFKITAYLTIITLVEVALGYFCYAHNLSHSIPNIFFVLLTLLKAGLIVSVFMHLGDEFKTMMMTIIIPLTLFIWFIIAFLADGKWWLWMNSTFHK